MTFAELKGRILTTDYLPKWLKTGIAAVSPSVNVTKVIPVIEPAPEGTPKWCPHGRVSKVMLKDDETATASKSAPGNRILYMRKNESDEIEIVGSSIQGSYCVGDRCQMWDVIGSDCGLKNPLLHVRTAIEDAKVHYDEISAPSAP